MENQMELKAIIHEQAERYKALMPHIGGAQNALTAEVYKTAALDAKTKRLMAMTAAVTHGCRACILYQADAAIALGASAEEILECIGVAVSLGGTMADGQATRLIGFLEEKGMI